MTKYLLKRLLHGLLSIIIVVGIIMILIYSLLDRNLVFASDPLYSKQSNNQKTTYMYSKWEEYGYLDYVTYADYLNEQAAEGIIDEDTRSSAVSLGKTAEKDSDITAQYVEEFTEYYESQGYTVVRLEAVMLSKKKVADGGQQALFAYKNIPLAKRMLTYFTNLIDIDDTDYVEEDIEDRGLTFTWNDPLYGGDKFSPALMGNGTEHKYLIYCDSTFPFIHQNMLTVNLGTSYTVNTGVDVFKTMTQSQGAYIKSTVIYPTGVVVDSADDLHSATYSAGSREQLALNTERFTDDYTNVGTIKNGKSKLGFSFVIGIMAVILSYILGIPVGILMARHKDKAVDKIGTAYIVFISAVPSLAYIFLFKAIGGSLFKLPTTFDLTSPTKAMYILPVISLALPAAGNLMKWLRRYMIDQQNSDYVKFARSGGLTENEIFRKHILKNAAIPIIHGIPADILFAMVGAIITERVYSVPGAGNLLTEAIAKYDNAVIVGVALFYAILSVVALILGDIVMAIVDPRISFTDKSR